MFHAIMLILFAQQMSLLCSIKLFFFHDFPRSTVETTEEAADNVVELELLEAINNVSDNICNHAWS